MTWWGILAVLAAVHIACDFTPLLTPWMIDAKKNGWPIHPIFAHAAIHGFCSLMTLGICWPLIVPPDNDRALNLFLLQFEASLFILLTHWAIDIIKGAIARYFPSTGDFNTRQCWLVIGLDQLAHFYILILVAYRLTTPA